uniref:Uncharacterized protein n=1 Tax=Tanacetum cinerariifolium TaxID=118510 RepID=A0A699JIF2_TANCI|nr:hypothetical protein [Tanacetum cinerariifolium]
MHTWISNLEIKQIIPERRGTIQTPPFSGVILIGSMRIQFSTPGFSIGIDDKHTQRKCMQDEATSVKIRERECNDQVRVNMEKVAALNEGCYCLFVGFIRR